MSFHDWQEQQQVTEFLYHEARLLDAHRWAEWLQLFTADGLYWVPLVHGQTDHLNHASLFLEDALLRSMRVRRLEQARAYSQQPVTRTAHVTGNVSVVSREADGLTVASTLHVLEWRKGDPRSFGGSVLHTLKTHGDSWRIAMKRIDLVNCEAPHEALQVFL
ncbi:aromatic-ring-hydroxylating dioxygenase subunit beta [Variovorax ginsengisoli]|uniref:Benzoate/toluate 1,2-dioxygenase beta subunit n=1 Tax=Variovorax ginsengisoli TaxID=363844 RepID=A0ABT9S1B9_9BURK|nr:aromatic-ring-hydroxylating dioxygenase subunit beta [Variovorax ginsengisoli]MDP9898153.1 benzoate/toluate 1,2-dioxygenase beta subunit [Variovorax ginsengisoli]